MVGKGISMVTWWFIKGEFMVSSWPMIMADGQWLNDWPSMVDYHWWLNKWFHGDLRCMMANDGLLKLVHRLGCELVDRLADDGAANDGEWWLQPMTTATVQPPNTSHQLVDQLLHNLVMLNDDNGWRWSTRWLHSGKLTCKLEQPPWWFPHMTNQVSVPEGIANDDQLLAWRPSYSMVSWESLG